MDDRKTEGRGLVPRRHSRRRARQGTHLSSTRPRVGRLRVLTASAVMLAGALGVATHADAVSGGPDEAHSPSLALLDVVDVAPGSPFPVTMSGRKVGNRFYVPEWGTGLHVFDISKPAAPRRVGGYALPHAAENEDIATNGQIALMTQAGDEGYATHPHQPANLPEGTGASKLVVLDVRDPSRIEPITTLVGAGAHTYECLHDCTWAYGTDGQIIDLRNVLRTGEAVHSERNWLQALGVSAPAHDVFEVRPGLVVTGTLPSSLVVDTRDPLNPVVLARSSGKPSYHQVSWPDAGSSRFILGANEGPTGSPTVRCEVTEAQDNDATFYRTAFQVWDASDLRALTSSQHQPGTFSELDRWRPRNGGPLDRKDPFLSVGGAGWSNGGCALHYFDPHPSFANGGLVAQSAFAHGLRLLQVDQAGQITEVGHYVPDRALTWAAYWITPQILYALDNGRLHVLRYSRR